LPKKTGPIVLKQPPQKGVLVFIMRLGHKAILGVFISALFAGCTEAPVASPVAPSAARWEGFAPSPLQDLSRGALPLQLRSVAAAASHVIPAPAGAKSGIYVSQYVSSVIYGFSKEKRSQKKRGPLCTVPWKTSGPVSLSVDGKGNLLEVDSVDFGTPINIGSGPEMCGPLAATIRDLYGYGDAVASRDALNGVVAVANQWDLSNYGFNPGSIAVCTVSASCTENLTNSAMYRVAIDPNGNCWASALNASSVATLTYFQGCSGSGQQASGYENPGYGALDIDAQGNLVAMSYVIGSYVTTLYVYSGCNPACKVVGGPFNLLGATVAGHLNGTSNKFITADGEYGQVDVYSYTPTQVKYLYSFKKGLTQIDDVDGVVANPASPE
jgi:hypothetical protein